ncbi:MAG: nucleoside-diphosphate kinase [bacterium]|nr:nucleoside-diphosphate kinase [bacterium]
MQYGLVILKPDSIRDSLENDIIRCLEEGGLEIVWKEYWQIRPEIVQMIYPEKVVEPTYSSTVKAISFGLSMVIVVKNPTNTDIWEVLRQLKGRMDTDGIRKKFCYHSKDELVLMGYDGLSLQDKLAENRLHTPDDAEGAATILALCREEGISVPLPIVALLCNRGE